MRLNSPINASNVKHFLTLYNSVHEDIAAHARGDFLSAFPRRSLPRLTPKSYCIGFKSPSFCTYVEVKTRPWANILGASATKFGIYFGRTKSDPTKRYRYADRFGDTEAAAFASVRQALVDLVDLGDRPQPDFAAIDANPLSQMFKAKVLSLYHPNRFLNVCSGDHLKELARRFDLDPGLKLSLYQHQLLGEKLANHHTRSWSNPKFVAFLYGEILNLPRQAASPVAPARQRRFARVDFDALMAQRAEIGQRAEQFARRWEMRRLGGLGYESPSSLLIDRRSQPGYGYDFLSCGGKPNCRYIEVKSIAMRGDEVRFFLSENELQVSLSSTHKDNYYFYLVRFKDLEPMEVVPVTSAEMHIKVRLLNASYEARLLWKS